MDPLTRSRRGQGARDPEEASAARDREYQTALSQAGANGVPGVVTGGVSTSGAGQGEASPGTLESGEAKGSSAASTLPVANPFHSERVRTEVELIRSRPATLDLDAARVQGDYDESALGDGHNKFQDEPDYATMTGELGREPEVSPRTEVPRVARVEPAPAVVSPIGVQVGSGGAAGQELSERFLEDTRGLGESGGAAMTPSLRPDVGTVSPRHDDPRELIPASCEGPGDLELANGDRLGRMETLLYQVLEENKALKRRLEQNESRSHSSWHSGIAVPEPQLSTATFGPRSEMDVQRFLSVEFPGHEAAGAMGSRFMVGGRYGEVFPEEPHSWAGLRVEDPRASLVAGFSSGSFGGYQPGPPINQQTARAIPPPPLPLPPAPVAVSIPEREIILKRCASLLRVSGWGLRASRLQERVQVRGRDSILRVILYHRGEQ